MAYTAGACGVHGLAVWSCVFAGVPLQVSSNPRVFAYVCLQCLPTATHPSFEVSVLSQMNFLRYVQNSQTKNTGS